MSDHHPSCILAAMCLALAAAGPSQAQQGPTQGALDDAVRLGTVAALAPLCGIRDDAWAFDLRRATIMDATRAPTPDDPALHAAPGSPLVVGALSFAEAEALESFAEASPDQTCEPLRRSADLARADDMVRTFRYLKAAPGS